MILLAVRDAVLQKLCCQLAVRCPAIIMMWLLSVIKPNAVFAALRSASSRFKICVGREYDPNVPYIGRWIYLIDTSFLFKFARPVLYRAR